MRRLLLLGIGILLSACATAPADMAPLSGEATLKDKDGKEVGRATIIETAEGVRVALTGYRLPPGPKGVHIHAVGQCQPPEFISAAAHFNPHGKKHGLKSAEGPHAGDLPNMVVSAAGEGGIDYTTKLLTLRSGASNSLFGDNGTSIVIHAQADDERTDPTGNSGGRIACGVVVK